MCQIFLSQNYCHHPSQKLLACLLWHRPIRISPLKVIFGPNLFQHGLQWLSHLHAKRWMWNQSCLLLCSYCEILGQIGDECYSFHGLTNKHTDTVNHTNKREVTTPIKSTEPQFSIFTVEYREFLKKKSNKSNLLQLVITSSIVCISQYGTNQNRWIIDLCVSDHIVKGNN